VDTLLTVAQLISATTVYYVYLMMFLLYIVRATLSQYLQDNTLSFVSDVSSITSYQENTNPSYCTTNIMIHHVENIVLSGNTKTLISHIKIYSDLTINIKSSVMSPLPI